jgi:hypothetical protein
MASQLHGFLRVFQALEKYQVNYVLIGGMAVIVHGMDRLTSDIDIFVRPDQANIERLRAALRSMYDDPAIEKLTIAELEQYPIIRYGAPDGFNIDIVIRLGTAFHYEDLQSAEMDVHGTKVSVATPETLYRMKKNTVRPQDKQDALFLRQLIERKSR